MESFVQLFCGWEVEVKEETGWEGVDRVGDSGGNSGDLPLASWEEGKKEERAWGKEPGRQHGFETSVGTLLVWTDQVYFTLSNILPQQYSKSVKRAVKLRVHVWELYIIYLYYSGKLWLICNFKIIKPACCLVALNSDGNSKEN